MISCLRINCFHIKTMIYMPLHIQVRHLCVCSYVGFILVRCYFCTRSQCAQFSSVCAVYRAEQRSYPLLREVNLAVVVGVKSPGVSIDLIDVEPANTWTGCIDLTALRAISLSRRASLTFTTMAPLCNTSAGRWRSVHEEWWTHAPLILWQCWWQCLIHWWTHAPLILWQCWWQCLIHTHSIQRNWRCCHEQTFADASSIQKNTVSKTSENFTTAGCSSWC